MLMNSLYTISANAIAAGFHALSDPLRIQVIELLRYQELCVCDLCKYLQTNQSKVSFHLKILKSADLVYARQEGRLNYYSLNLSQFLVLQQYLEGFGQYRFILPAHRCYKT